MDWYSITNKFSQILKSRLTYFKYRNTEWFKKRTEICRDCNFNSLNAKEQNPILVTLNLTKEYCTACGGCGIKWKASLPEAVCGREEIGLEPKWQEENVN